MFLAEAYELMLVEGAPRFAAAFDLLADLGSLPAVFHCAAGKDRTGLLAALVLAVLGVDAESIVEDYALTQDVMHLIVARMLERHPERVETIGVVPAGFFAASPEAMWHVLARLTYLHGSVRNYVRNLGVSADVIESLEGALVVPV